MDKENKWTTRIDTRLYGDPNEGWIGEVSIRGKRTILPFDSTKQIPFEITIEQEECQGKPLEKRVQEAFEEALLDPGGAKAVIDEIVRAAGYCGEGE